MNQVIDMERRLLLDEYTGLRVTDVSDGLDLVGHQDLGLMDPSIRPIFRDTVGFKHRFVGFAHTLRFTPTNRPITGRTPAEMREQIRAWYREIAGGAESGDPRGGCDRY